MMSELISIDDVRVALKRQLTVLFALMMLVFCAALFVIIRGLLFS